MKTLSSYHQQRLWFIDYFEKDDLYDGSPIYHNIPLYLKLDRKVSNNELSNSFEALVQRHEVLRTSLVSEDGKVSQVIAPAADFDFARIAVNETNIAERLESLRQVPLDFDCLMKVYVEQKEEETHVLVVLHHAIVDRFSVKTIRKELLSVLNNASITTAPIKYSNYSDWQNSLSNDDLESLIFHWKSKLHNLQVLYLPTDTERDKIHKYASNSIKMELPKAAVAAFAKKHRLSPRSLFLSAYKMTLARFSGLSDIVIGSFMNPREDSSQVLLGPVENLVVLRSQIETEKSLLDINKVVDETWVEAEGFKALPFDRLVSEINPKKDMSRTALFDVLFAYDAYEEGDENTAANNEGWGKYDFNLLVKEQQESFELILTYNDLYFRKGTVQSVMQLIERILETTVTEEHTALRDISLVSEEEREVLIQLGDFKDHKSDQTIVSLFAEQVAKNKDNIALTCSSGSYTYQEIDEKSSRLANVLNEKLNIQLEDKVAVILSEKEEIVVTLLAVLKSGAAYVPIHPDYPDSRKEFIIQDAECKLVIDDAFFDKWSLSLESASSINPNNNIAPANLAYIIYTSGTTGQPKGVLIENRNVISLLNSCYEKLNVTSNDTWLFFHSYCFDFSVWEIFGSLLSGGTVCIAEDADSKNAKDLSDLMNRTNTTVFSQTPSAFYNFIEVGNEVPSLRYVVFGGEALNPHKLKTWAEKHPQVDLINMYGITETTVHVTYKKLEIEDLSNDISNIGKPLSFAKCYVLNKEQQLLPYGMPGELYVAGSGLARGYVNRPKLNEERFLKTNSFGVNETLYRTGDLVRYMENGELEYLGRVDDQVKIRGYRIELDEIKRQLQTFDKVKQVAVKVFEHTDGDKSIVAYVSAANGVAQDDIRSYIATRLPEYMIPTFIIVMDHIPLNSNGKIDKASLPSPLDVLSANTDAQVPPENPVEETIFAIWKEILGSDNFGTTENFFEIGGHSLRATRLMASLQKEFNVKIGLKDIFENASIKEQARFVNAQEKSTFTEIPQVEESEYYPISSAQRRLWVLSQMEGGSKAYNMPSQISLKGSHSIDDFKKAILAVVDRHEILRTVFVTLEDGAVMQKVIPTDEMDFEIEIIDFRNEEDPKAACSAYITTDAEVPFDLENGPLLRAAIIQVSDQEYTFYYNMHHIISDGWSMEVLSKDVLAYYEAFTQDTEPQLPELRIQYKDYAQWQLNEMSRPEFEEHKNYWTSKLEGEIPLIDLPSRKQRPKVKSYKGAVQRTYLSPEITSSVNQFAKEGNGSLFTTLLATWKVLLHKYTSLTDLVVGSPVSGRDHNDLADQIGFYVNTLVLRNSLHPEKSFKAFQNQVHEATLASYEHQLYSFDQLVEDVDPKVDPSRSPFFDIIFTLQTKNHEVDLGEVTEKDSKEIILKEDRASKFDLQVIFEEEGDQLSFHIGYNTDVYDNEMISALMIHFKELLNQVMNNPEVQIAAIDYLSVEEKEQLLVSFNDSISDYPKEKSVVELFAEQVQETPEATAIVFEGKTLTYAELDTLSNQMAHYLLQNYELSSEDFIGIKLDRNEWHIVAILAILKAGCAYVPIDVDYPEDRIAFMETDSHCQLSVDAAFVKEFDAVKETYGTELPQLTIGANQLAYVIYTSGSTGKPKGVLVEHQSIVRLVKATNYCQLTEDNVLLTTGSFSFDATIFEFFGTLLNGAKLVITSKDTMLDARGLAKEIEQNSVEVMWFTSGWLNQLVDTHLELFAPLKTVLVGGDRLSPIHIEKLKKAHKELNVINAYGPTENTTFTTTYPIEEVTADIPIGYPISNGTIYVLDETRQLVPVGVTGEIYLGGDGLSRGYLNRPDLTEEKFVPNPFKEGERLYRTGDLGAWLPNGALTFVGRVDNQVKVNGHRIELGEIEYQLQNKEGINEVVVLIEEVADQEKQINAYFVSEEEENVTTLRSYLSNELPDYMLPHAFVQVEEMPLNGNGKVDKKALLALDNGVTLNGADYEAPTNELEAQLAEVWGAILNRKTVGITDDFFELGGNSLKLLNLINEFHKKFDYKITMKEIFSYRTVKEQAELIGNAKKDTYVEIEKVPEEESYPVSVTQKRLLLLSHMDESSVAYNMPTSMVLKDVQDIEKFKTAVHATIERHEILRTVFREDTEGNNRQWVLSKEELNFKIEEVDFRSSTDAEKGVNDYITQDSYAKFDLVNGPLLRASLLRISDEDYIFYYNMHHIIGDGWSIEVLSKDVMAFYKAFLNDTTPELPELRIQYKDYAIWQLNRFKNNEVDISKLYWFNQFKGDIPTLDLSFSKPRPKMKTFTGDLIPHRVSKEALDGLNALAARTETTLFMNLMCMFGMVLNRYSHQKEFIVGSPMVARMNAELKDQIGFYVNTLIYGIDIDTTETYQEMLQKMKNKVLENFEYREYPFDLLVEDLGQGKDFSRNPLFDAMLVINEHQGASSGSVKGSSNIRFKNQGVKSKFDITFTFNVYKEKINCNVIFNTDLYDRQDVEEMLSTFMGLIDTVLEDDSLTVNDYINSMIQEEELQEHDSFFSEMMKSMDSDF
ncbi:amino acid adenylation domain-containing protein [Aureisphaera galaxeae]|uniref:non-ribosomal peptide synthetase n=1 Tax=Aureisphaera galaxeae TaxID=1538023 RepID=UPI00235029EE|nr:non-ribosomal peptide synthetase [Aureisphaera galaxeae]MDC8004735.1 amino acid adenylation domain-containing protein [Aureisphaera galaxeae]